MIPLYDNQKSGRFPWMTLLLIAINCYVFYLEFTSPNPDLFIQHYALIPKLINLSNPTTWWPLLSATFLHGGLAHIFFNMLFLWIFGDNVEERLGLGYIPFYLLGGIIGNLVQYFFMPEATIPVLGASGAVAAVLGAYFVLFPTHTVATIVPIFFLFTIISLPAIVVLGFWFVTQLFNGYAAIADTAQGGIAYFAHIGGFAFGWLSAVLIDRDKGS